MPLSIQKIILHVLLPLVAGAAIYYICNPGASIVQRMLPAFLIPEQPLLHSSKSAFVRILLFNGPDFCWSYSFVSSLLFWQHAAGNQQRYFRLIILLLLLGQELIQLLLPGYFSFDIADMIAALIAFLLSLYLNRHYV
jgi:hypothetical protein